jgi:hypothetical protein
MSSVDEGPVSGGLQFDRAEVVSEAAPAGATQCAACRQAITARYYHAQGQPVCGLCAQRIESGQQRPPAVSLLPAALYGAAAALAGTILYAAVAILTGWEIGLVAIVVGVMVGKAVRRGSKGLGGRPQQVLAVLLTYFSITTSYIPVFIHSQMKQPPAQVQTEQNPAPGEAPAMSPGRAVVILLLLAAAAPFLALASDMSALISLFIIFIGLHQAWKITGRTDILIMGPYELNSST